MTSPLYFAYGSNLNRLDLEVWAAELKMPLGRMTPAGRAWLPDHRLAFSLHSARRQGGVLDMQPQIGQVVPGLLFHMDDIAWAAIDRKEGVNDQGTGGYEWVPAMVIDEAGRLVTARTYKVNPAKRQTFVKPHPRYVEVVLQGYEDHSLDEHLAARSASVALALVAEGGEAENLISELFIYGTLMEGECRRGFLYEVGFMPLGKAQTRGRLVDLGTFPALVLPVEDPAVHEAIFSPVPGELVHISNAAQAWPVLDEVEDFPGYEAVRQGQTAMYHRTLVVVEQTATSSGNQTSKRRLAWTYALADRELPQRPIPSNSWREHTGRFV